MRKYIPLELSLAQRLAAAEPETRFCGFCRTEQAAVEELKEVMAKPAAELLFSPSLAYLEDLEKKQGFGTVDECDPLDKAVLSAQMPGPAPAEDGPNLQLKAYATGLLLTGADYSELESRIASLGCGTLDQCDPVVLQSMMPGSLGDADADELSDDLEHAQATIKEMGELIDQQAAELERLKLNVNYMVEGCTCNRAQGIPAEQVNEIRGTV